MSFKIRVQRDWHQAIVGKTGSGKTTLLSTMAAGYAARLNLERVPAYYQIFILDTKHEGDFDHLGMKYENMEEAVNRSRGSRIVVYEPSEEEDDFNHYELFLRLIWDRWLKVPGSDKKKRVPSIIIVDELTQLEIKTQSRSHIKENSLHYWAQIMKRGRASGVVMWNGTQNPINCPEDFLRNASQYWCFSLGDENDRAKMASYMGSSQIKQPIPDLHGFWYVNTDMSQPQYVKQLIINPPERRSVNGSYHNSIIRRH